MREIEVIETKIIATKNKVARYKMEVRILNAELRATKRFLKEVAINEGRYVIPYLKYKLLAVFIFVLVLGVLNGEGVI